MTFATISSLSPKLTDAIDAVHPGLRDVTFVTIEEIKSGDWGIAGEPVTRHDPRPITYKMLIAPEAKG